MGRKKVKQFTAHGSKTASIPLKNPKEVRRRGSRRRKRTARSKGQREKIQNGQRRNKRFENEGGAEMEHQRSGEGNVQ